ncbi:MAG: DNA polymerase III subunit chi [Pseudomonadota bacterium]
MSTETTTEVLFYHLNARRLEDVLPSLLEACMTRDWRAVLQAGSTERLDALDTHLWTYRDDGFLPHGLSSGKFPEQQPILLTTGREAANDAKVKFFVDGAEIDVDELKSLTRAVLIFDGQDEAALNSARAQWAVLKKAGLSPTYWQQNDNGRWEKQALN